LTPRRRSLLAFDANGGGSSGADLEAFYGPFSPVRRVSTPARHALSPGAVSRASFYDLDHLLASVYGLRTSGQVAASLLAGGKGLNYTSCLTSTLGESVERLVGVLSSLGLGGDRQLRTCEEIRSAGFDVLGPERLFTFSREDRANVLRLYDPFEVTAPMVWTEAISLVRNQPVLVPAQLVPLFYAYQPGESRLQPTNSGGLAAGKTYDDAVSAGFMELCERDALNLAWFARVSPRRLQIASKVRARLARRLRLVDRALDGIELRYLDSAVEGVHVVLAFRIREGAKRGTFSVGAKASLDPTSAVVGAIAELLECDHALAEIRNHPNSRRTLALLATEDPGGEGEPGDVKTFFGAVLYYGYPSNHSKLEAFVRTCDEVDLACLEATPNSTANLVQLLRAAEVDPLVVRLDSSIPGRCPHVVRVIAPELTPPNDPKAPQLGHPRYYQRPRETGVGDQALHRPDLQDLPLPFP